MAKHFYLTQTLFGREVLFYSCESVSLFVCDSVCLWFCCDYVIKITQKVLDQFSWNFAGSFLIIKWRSSSNVKKKRIGKKQNRVQKNFKKRHNSKSVESISIKSSRTLCYCKIKVMFTFEKNRIDRTQTESKNMFHEDHGRHRNNLGFIN